MKSKHLIRAVVVGYGNIGRYAVEAILQEKDFELAGIIDPFIKERPVELGHISFVEDISELRDIQVALLCIPTRAVCKTGMDYLTKGICTVDIFDLHGQELLDLYNTFDRCAKEHGAASLSAAGWDPGADSVVRALMKVMIPKGITYTNFGPGMSMGHSVVAKSKPGVEDAVSLTFPKGSGIHRRMVYVRLAPGGDKEAIARSIKEDPYFSNEDVNVLFVKSLDDVRDYGHSSLIERKGRAGIHSNQRTSFHAELNNPAVTSQVLVAAARAITKQKPGAYTMNQVAMADFLDLTTEEMILTLI